ncbi:winged helix-turn-helix transcriptional regulator [Candidatus Woesearchaeota archaeon]|nr:winged helix-turn-helix transcriptional regulator [Candidatus Woesearchaeota archaeon]
MNNKHLGLGIIAIGIVFAVILGIFKIQVDELTDTLMESSGGSCVVGGVCTHEQSNIPVVIGSVMVVLTISFGTYLYFFTKRTESFETVSKELINEISQTKDKELKGEKLNILLSGLDEDERKVLLAVKEQDGISQTTLGYRTDISKTKLSVILQQLERKGLLSKVKKGKINNIYLKKPI